MNDVDSVEDEGARATGGAASAIGMARDEADVHSVHSAHSAPGDFNGRRRNGASRSGESVRRGEARRVRNGDDVEDGADVTAPLLSTSEAVVDRLQQTTSRPRRESVQPANVNSTATATGRRKGHLRGTRSNGFASGPPFTKRSKKRQSDAYSHAQQQWGAMLNDEQKKQQLERIEKQLDVMAQESQMGIGRWRPAFIQRFATRNWMLFLLCWFCSIQGMLINGLIPSSISTIERRFLLSTSTMGRIMQFYDFGYVLFCIPVSYFGGRHSKSTVLGTGLALMAFGSFLFTMPHMIAEPYTSTYNSDSTGLSKCTPTGSANGSVFMPAPDQSALLEESEEEAQAEFDALRSCPSPENQPGTFRYVFLFCLAHFLHGIGATPLFTIGVSYLDENVGPALSSLYLGVFYAFAIFGPALGFLASSTFLQYHTDFMKNLSKQKFASIVLLEETDPKWVGAWYVGFLLVTFLASLAVFPLLTLPKVLPESLKWHRTRLREETMVVRKRAPECCGMPPSSKTAAMMGSLLHLDEKGPIEPTPVPEAPSVHLQSRQGPIWYQLWLDVRHIPIAIYRILLNGPYMLITLGMAIDGLIVTGCSTYMGKYLERQFGVAPSKANLLIGAVMVPMAGCGTMLAGFLIHHFRMSCVRTLQFCVALVVCSLMLSPMYFIYCDHDKLVGIEAHYPVGPSHPSFDAFDGAAYNASVAYDSDEEFHLEAACNRQCQCSPTEYHPVCAEFLDGSQVAFYSPCYAGCPQEYSPLQKEYTNCTCVPDATKGGWKRVKRGTCESKCRGLFAFLVFFAPFCFFTFSVGVALITVVLRTVDYEERSFALGIQWILVRVIGTIPAPVVFGWLFDVSCIRQNLDPCSGVEHGSCMLYQNKSLADLFLAFSVGGQFVAIICLLSVLMFFASSLRDDPLPITAADAPVDDGEGDGEKEEEKEGRGDLDAVTSQIDDDHNNAEGTVNGGEEDANLALPSRL